VIRAVLDELAERLRAAGDFLRIVDQGEAQVDAAPVELDVRALRGRQLRLLEAT